MQVTQGWLMIKQKKKKKKEVLHKTSSGCKALHILDDV